MECLITKLLIRVAKLLPQKVLAEYLAEFEYSSYLFYRRHHLSLFDSVGNAFECLHFYHLAKIEYNHYRLLCLGILDKNVDSWENILMKDSSCSWSKNFNERCDNLSTKWWSLRWFFKGKSAKNFSNLEIATFTYLIEQYQGKFYHEVYEHALSHPVIRTIYHEEQKNETNFLSLLANCYPDSYEMEVKKWNNRKMIMWLLIPLDLAREFITKNWNECIAEVSKTP